MSASMITSEKKQTAIASVRMHQTDTGSAHTQVAVATERIKELTGHLKVHSKDFAARRGLLQLVGRRRRLLKYIADHDSQAYLELIQKLGIRR
jgi:small subunit ribosomal protein S15